MDLDQFCCPSYMECLYNDILLHHVDYNNGKVLLKKFADILSIIPHGIGQVCTSKLVLIVMLMHQNPTLLLVYAPLSPVVMLSTDYLT